MSVIILLTRSNVRYPPTDEMFFVQNAGAASAGTGLNKSNIIMKIALPEAMAVSSQRNATGSVNVQTVDAPAILNSNGKPYLPT